MNVRGILDGILAGILGPGSILEVSQVVAWVVCWMVSWGASWGGILVVSQGFLRLAAAAAYACAWPWAGARIKLRAPFFGGSLGRDWLMRYSLAFPRKKMYYYILGVPPPTPSNANCLRSRVAFCILR